MDVRRRLSELHISDVKVTSRELGRGSYGVVLEVDVNGLACAAKKLHDFIQSEQDRQARAHMGGRFVEEVFQHSRLRHPNIVQLLGVYFPSPNTEFPMMILEKMDMSLGTFLEKFPQCPIAQKHELVVDINRGLLHLHSQTPSIIHRDLSANNVLLTPQLTAKIADLGMVRIVKTNPSLLSRFSKMPGTAVYMPPEANSDSPTYNTSLDVFSFGVLILQTFTSKFPEPSADRFVPIANDPGKYRKVSEVERRRKDLQVLGKEHSHIGIIQNCLIDEPKNRPSTKQVFLDLQAMSKRIGCSPSKIELLVKKGTCTPNTLCTLCIPSCTSKQPIKVAGYLSPTRLVYRDNDIIKWCK